MAISKKQQRAEEAEAHQAACAQKLPASRAAIEAMTDKELKIAEAIAHQFTCEQNLVSNRLNWNLTFQGFMMAAYAVVAAAEHDPSPARPVIHAIIAIAGILIAGCTLLGVRASQGQRDELRTAWWSVIGSNSPYPRPFSKPGGSIRGRLAPQVICGVLMSMWAALLVIGVLDAARVVSASPAPAHGKSAPKTKPGTS